MNVDQKEFFLLGGSRYFWAYSGRFMYGESCPAIEAGSFEELAEFLEEVMDELGRGMVFYWPHVRLTAEEVKAFAKEDV